MTTPLTLLASEAVALAKETTPGPFIYGMGGRIMLQSPRFNLHAVQHHAALAAGYLAAMKANAIFRDAIESGVKAGAGYYSKVILDDPELAYDSALEVEREQRVAAVEENVILRAATMAMIGRALDYDRPSVPLGLLISDMRAIRQAAIDAALGAEGAPR